MSVYSEVLIISTRYNIPPFHVFQLILMDALIILIKYMFQNPYKYCIVLSKLQFISI